MIIIIDTNPWGSNTYAMASWSCMISIYGHSVYIYTYFIQETANLLVGWTSPGHNMSFIVYELYWYHCIYFWFKFVCLHIVDQNFDIIFMFVFSICWNGRAMRVGSYIFMWQLQKQAPKGLYELLALPMGVDDLLAIMMKTILRGNLFLIIIMLWLFSLPNAILFASMFCTARGIHAHAPSGCLYGSCAWFLIWAWGSARSILMLCQHAATSASPCSWP